MATDRQHHAYIMYALDYVKRAGKRIMPITASIAKGKIRENSEGREVLIV